MIRQPLPGGSPVLIRCSTREVLTPVSIDELRRGVPVRAAEDFIQSCSIDTTDLAVKQVVSVGFGEFPDASSLGISHDIADCRRENLPIQLDRAGHARSSAGAIPQDRPRGAGPGEQPHACAVSSTAAQDLALAEGFRRMRCRCETAQDKKAWEDFCKVECPNVVRIVSGRLSCRHDVEDAAQDVWRSVFDQLPELELDPARGSLAAWIATIAKRKAYKYAPRQMRHQGEPLTPQVCAEIRDRGVEPPIHYARLEGEEELIALIEELKASLPDRQRQIAGMRWIREMPVKEIAAER